MNDARHPSSSKEEEASQRAIQSKLVRVVKRVLTQGWIGGNDGLARRHPNGSKRSEGARSQRGESRAPENRTVYGYSCRESFAEVGEKHLLHAIKGSREANRESVG